jgi:hypothetical protein
MFVALQGRCTNGKVTEDRVGPHGDLPVVTSVLDRSQVISERG